MTYCNIFVSFDKKYLKYFQLIHKEPIMAMMIKKAETLFERFEAHLELLAEKLL
jgi:hypothetical protein